MISRGDEEAAMQNVSEEELLVHVRGGAGEERTAALKELLRRPSTRVRPVVGQLIADPTAPVELKTIAAHALGQQATPENETTLLTALTSDHPTLVLAAAKSLGRIGGARAYDALVAVRVKEGAPIPRSVAFARTLISYRLGLGRERLQPPPPSAILEVKPQSSVLLRFETVEPRVLRERLPALDRNCQPSRSLKRAPSVSRAVRNTSGWCLRRRSSGRERSRFWGSGSEWLRSVLKESSCPEGWYVYEYILTHPRETTTAAIFGLKPSGGLSHYGEVSLDGANARVRMRAVNTAGVLAIEFAGEFQGLEGALVIREALAATTAQDGQKRPAIPRRQAERTG